MYIVKLLLYNLVSLPDTVGGVLPLNIIFKLLEQLHIDYQFILDKDGPKSIVVKFGALKNAKLSTVTILGNETVPDKSQF
jgi:hypothetical protein